jgi:hypothetical protein
VSPRKDMRSDVESWDVRVERAWPFFHLDQKPYEDAVPPVRVYIGVNFNSEASALEFETAVRALLVPEAA